MATPNPPAHGDWFRGPDGHIAASFTPQPWIITKKLPEGYWLSTKAKRARPATGNAATHAITVDTDGPTGNTQFVKIQIGWLRPDLKRYHSGHKKYIEISFFPELDNRVFDTQLTPYGQNERNWTILASGRAAAIQVGSFMFTKQFFKFKTSIPSSASDFSAWQIPGESPKDYQAVSNGSGDITWATL